MSTFISNAIAWIKNNILLAVLIGAGVLILFAGKQLKKIIFGSPRRRRRRVSVVKTRVVRRSRPSIKRVNRKPLPRSVGMRKVSGKGYPAAGGGTIPFKYNKDGTVKKAWQVAGTVAAKSRMKRLRSAR